MTPESAAKTHPLFYGIVAFLSLFAGLCTVFALVVTVPQAWQEHAQAQWPQATASVEKCRLLQTSTRGRLRYYVDCRLSYVVGNAQVQTKLYSRNVPSPDVWQYPRLHEYEQFEEWVEQHPPGTTIALRYDPAHPQKAVLVATDTPFGGPHTPNNLKLLGVAAAIFVALLVIARIGRVRSVEITAETT